jgi:SAM-dependent methyltransferase
MNIEAISDDFRTWDSAWSSLSGDRIQLFTRGKPGTLYQFWQRCYAEDLWPLVDRSGGKGRYLEVGAGRGTTSMYLASRGCDVTLLDYSPSGLDVAQANFAREGLPAPHLVMADARDTGLAAEQYDCVFSLGLLEHFDDPTAVVEEMLRVLKPGGWLYALVVPRRPASARFLAYGLFAPWRLAPHVIPPRVRQAVRRIWRRGASDEAVPLRTGFDGDDYVRMLAAEPVTDVHCCPYNPYHDVYASKAAERWILVPAYRLHHALRKRFAGPSARTAGAIASCLLLTCRKSDVPQAQASHTLRDSCAATPPLQPR